MLDQFLTTELFAFLLIFCRVGAAIMLLPGFGEIYVSSRIRLVLALMFAVALTPVLSPALPAVPTTVTGLFAVIISEILVGLFMGGISKLLISAMHTAGTIIAYQSSLISAVVPDIGQSQQGTALNNILSMTALVLLFVTDLHHVMLKGLADSYSLFHAGEIPLVEDIAAQANSIMNGAFRTALQLAAPHIIIGLMLYLGAGIIARLMPNMQIFFILMAPQLLLSFFIFMISISTIMIWYMDYFRITLSSFLSP